MLVAPRDAANMVAASAAQGTGGVDDHAIRDRIRELLAQHRLQWPSQMRKLVAQLGRGDRCLVCGESITSPDIEYTFRDDDTRHVHRRCFVLWMEALAEER